jgi:uncharacterized repeat protein (TIGR02543 family)
MAKVLQTTLQIAESNVEQYCTADGLSLNTGGYAIRLYMNGHTRGSAILNDAAKEVLYPSATAHPFKIDSFIRANKSGGSMTISLQFNGTSVQSETGDWGSELKNKTKTGISDPVVINSNRSTEIKWHIKGSSTVSRFSIASTKLTFYFNQYEMRPLVGNNANGIQKVTVSNASPCYGDTVVFTPKLVQGATWAGWYSDAACTNLVSADQNYSVSPNSDITLYAKATIDATLYNVNAVAGSEITSVNVSDNVVPEGSTATFTAQVNTGCSFEAWYSDDTYTTIVSTENPYTATITANTTLYAKAHRNSLNMSVGSAEHGTASVSATTVPYGNDVTFTFTPEDDTWELYGWYSDSGLTQLVSEANPYTFTATEDVTLYPKVGKKRYTIKYGRDGDIFAGGSFQINIIVVDFNSLTHDEINYLRTGDYDNIDSSKIVARDSMKDSNAVTSSWKTIQCTYDMYIAVYLPEVTILGDRYYAIVTDGDKALAYWPYYWFQPTADATISSHNYNAEHACNCSSVAKDGIAYAYATTPTYQDRGAIFEAELFPGYTFSGWYSDEACTTLVSTDNPAKVITPKYTTDSASQTSLTLYAKATKAIYTISVGTAEHGSATVSATTAYYGDTVTFNCTVDEGYEFNGWYSDEELTQLVSEANPYTHSMTGNVTLYPKVGKKQYTIKVEWSNTVITSYATVVRIVSVDLDKLTKNDLEKMRNGSYDSISSNAVFGLAEKTCGIYEPNCTISLNAPIASTVSIYAYHSANEYNENIPYFKENGKTVSNGNVYIFTVDSARTFNLGLYDRCDCSAIAGDGINYAYAFPEKAVQEKSVEFEAEVAFGYTFSGWYSDEACTRLVSTDNPAYVVTPRGEHDEASNTFAKSSLTLYAKAVPLTSTTGISFKTNGTWKNALAVFKKTNGAWVQQSNPKTLFSGSSTGSESNYIYCGDVSS